MPAVGGAVSRKRVAFVQRAIIKVGDFFRVVAIAKRAESKRERKPALINDLAVVPMQPLQILGEHRCTALNAMRGEVPLYQAFE
ncbi:MAG: hypothetical protein ABI680_00795 [Chthoniobacteraceae bacterium]